MRKAFVEQPVALPEPRFRDGLGIRYVRTDGTDDPVEVLRPLWDVGMMQNAIRQRVSRLASFRQARFVPVRAAEVPRDDASTVEVVSDYVSGHRLSQYLEASQIGVLSIERSTAIYVLRELLGALALLHESRGVTHGAVGPERLLITPKGRVVVADYVLGPAIERLEFTRPRLWREFHIPMPAGKGLPKLDDKADVLQVGVTALALLLGRPIELADYPERLESLLASLGQSQKAAGRAPLPAAMVAWLKRALFKDPNGKFANVSEARLSLEAVLSNQDVATGGAAALKALAEAFGRHAAALEAKAAAAAAEAARNAALAAQAASQAALQEQAAVEAAAAPLTDLVPAFGATVDAPAASAATPSARAVEPDDAVGWRVPEAPPEEETLPTSPLLRIEEPLAETAAEAFAEEVLDLAGIEENPDTEAIPADATLLAEAVTAPAEAAVLEPPAAALSPVGAEVEIIVDLRELDAGEEPPQAVEAAVAAAPTSVFEALEAVPEPVEAALPFLQVGEEPKPVALEPPIAELEQPAAFLQPVEEALAALDTAPAVPPPAHPEDLPEWRLLADPVGAVAPTIDVEVPTETLEELVEAFAATSITGTESPVVPAPTRCSEEPVTSAPEPSVELLEPTPVRTDRPAPSSTFVDAGLGTPQYDAEPSWVPYEAPAAAIESVVVEHDAPLTETELPAIVGEPPVADAAPALAEAPPEPVEAPATETRPAFHEAETPAIVMEPPSVMLRGPVPFLEERISLPAPTAVPSPGDAAPAAAASSVLDEILSLQESQTAAQAAVDLTPEAPPARTDVAAWSFVEELLHHDARFEPRGAAEDDGPETAAEPLPPHVVEPGAARLAELDTAPPDPLPAFFTRVAAVEASTAIEEASATPEPADERPELTTAIADEAASTPGETAPVLPPDWFIEVGPQPAAPAQALAEGREPSIARGPRFVLDREPVSGRKAPVVAPVPLPPVSYQEPGESALEPPPGSPRSVQSEPEEDLSGPVFPRVAPSVRRVRAEARRRRVARVRRSVGQGIRAVASGCASAVTAVAGAVVAVFSSTGRAVAAVLGALLSGSVAATVAIGRGIGAVVRALAQGSWALVRGTARGGAAAARAVGTLGIAVATGALRVALAIVRTSGGVLGAVLAGGAHALRAGVSAAATFAGATARALGAATRACGRGASAAARALASALAALGRAGSAAVVGTARGIAALFGGVGTLAGRAADRAASAASTAGSAAGRAAAATGKGAGRAAASLPQRLYFLFSDIADRLPRPVVRPWYFAAALLVIVAVAGVPYAKALLFTAKPAMGSIRIESPRPDDMVSIDGVPHGRVPVTASVTAGRHRIEIGAAGKTGTHDVVVAEGRETLLQAAGPGLVATGSIRVTTDPPGADVLLDGMLHGTAPLTVYNLSEGAHALLVRDKSGSVRQTVRVTADGIVDATVQIRPGWLAVFAPVKLNVLENGRPIGSTEGGRILVSPGPHTFEVASEALGFRETRQVEIKPGIVAAVTIPLPPATIEIVAPAESEILVDGQSVGQAPLAPLEVAVGTREIVMRHPTLGERRQVVTVTYAAPVKVVFE
jgi:hypothetical protein